MASDSRIATAARLAVVLLLFTFMCLWYVRWIPPFEGPDEPEHFAYVVRLAEGGGLPPQGDAAWETPVRQEASQPPLYYFLASLPARLVDLDDPPAEYRPNPHFPSSAPGTLPDNKNVAIHYPADTETLRGGWLALALARGVSVVAGLLLIVAAYGLVREMAPGRPALPLAAATFLALVPQVIFMSSLVSNDMTAAATAALALWGLASLLRRGPSFRRAFLVGLALGLALLSKTSNLALALPLAAGIIWLWLSRRRPPGTRRTALRDTAAAALTIVVVAAALAGWWYVRSWRLYDSPLGVDTHFRTPWALASPAERIRPVAAWREVFFSFWAAFGWGNIKYPGWVYALVGLLTLAAVAGMLRLAWHGRARGALWQPPTAVFAICLFALAAFAISLEFWMQRVTAPHGRLLFPALGPAAGLLVMGWDALHRRLPLLAASGMGLLAILSPIILIRPAYAPPGNSQPQLLESDGPDAKPGWRYGDLAELEQIALARGSVAAGDVLPITLCWRPLDKSGVDYSILLQLVGPESRIVAGRRTYPGLGSYPTTTWEPGRRFCDTVRVDIPADLAQTLLYKVEVGLIDHAAEERLPAYAPDGRLQAGTFAAAVRLEAAGAIRPDLQPPGDDPIRLVSADFPPQFQAGVSQAVTLRWWLADALDHDYTVYIHFRRPGAAGSAAQGDGPPLDGWYPTSAWRAGELVVDRHTFTLPAELEPGSYDLVVGWYEPVSGDRLGTEHLLGTIEAAQ